MTDHLDRVALVAERLAVVHERISRAGGTTVRVLPVTKTFPLEWCLAAHATGCTEVGENYAQEVASKFGGVSVPFGVRFIGQLQTNKVRVVASLVTVFETVDRVSLVDELAKRVPGARVLVQVAPDGHVVGKGGCELAKAPALVEYAVGCGLRVEGLMAVGPTEGGPEAARPLFRATRALADRLGLGECSMGMTADLEVAVQEGATQIRVGSALFGERPPFGTSVR